MGAGPVGLALAFKLARNGIAAIVLESGDEHGAAAACFKGIDVPAAHHASPDRATACGIGGTSRIWGGRCVPLDDIDFEQRDHVPHSGWPISHAELSGYYDEALAFLGCGSGEPAALAAAASGDVSTEVLERWSRQPDLDALHRRDLEASRLITVHTGCTVTGLRLEPDGERVAALNVLRNGQPLEVEAETFVLAGGGLGNARLLLAAQRAWPLKFGGLDGPLGRFYTGHLTGYLAKIRFHSPRFAEALRFHNDGAGALWRRRLAVSARSQLVHSIMNTAFWFDSFSVADPAHGSGVLSAAYLALASLGLYRRLESGLAPSSPHSPNGDAHRHWANIRSDPSLVRNFLDVVSDFLRNGLGKRVYALPNPQGAYLLRYHAEQSPDPDNRLSLTGGRDGAPLPSGRVDYRFHAHDARSVLKSHELLDNWLRANRLGQLEYLWPAESREAHILGQATDGYHQIGLTRMSADPRRGVVDADCRVHGVDNLFVAGSSVFPTAGQANPTLAAVALAMRLADRLSRPAR